MPFIKKAPLHETVNPSAILGLYLGRFLFASLQFPLEHNLEKLPFISHELVLQGDEHQTSAMFCPTNGCLSRGRLFPQVLCVETCGVFLDKGH